MLSEKLSVEDLLDDIHDMLDKSWDLPLSGGKTVVDGKKVRDILEKIRAELPSEIQQAQNIVADRNDIISDARKESERIIKKAEERAAALVSEQAIVAESKGMADEIVGQANAKARDTMNKLVEYSDTLLKQVEEEMVKDIRDIRKAREGIRSTKRDF